MLSTIRQSVRSLARAPGYAAAFVLTLGLGIGLNTAIFSVIHGVLLAPLPYPDADRIIYVQQPVAASGVPNARFSFQEVAYYRDASHTLDQFVEYGDWTFTVVADEEPHRAVGGLVTSNYFDVLDLRAALGRTLGPPDDGEGAEPVAVLTHDYWVRAFGRAPDVIGRTLRLYAFSEPTTTRVVGVLQPGRHYTGTRSQDFFVNYATNEHYQSATMQNARAHRMTDVFARLREGQSPDAAQAELAALSTAAHETYPEAYPAHLGFSIRASLWQDELTSGARSTLLVLMGTVVLVLILACANVANLTLTRLVRRERDLTVRAALGAGKSRLRRELLTENLVLALGGAALGLLLSSVGLDLLVQYTNRFTVRTGEIRIDVTVLTFTALVAVAVAVLLAWAPSLPGVQGIGNAAGAAGGARGGVGVSRRGLQRALVVSQLALSFTLLIGAGLLVRSLVNLTRVDTGIDYESVVTMQVPNTTGTARDENQLLMDRLVQEIARFPGVRVAAYASRAPFEPTTLTQRTIRVEGMADDGVVSPLGQLNVVSTDYFQTVGIPLVSGRAFTSLDDDESERVVIINEAMSRDFFGGDDPIGRRLSQQQFDGSWGEWTRVVGVAADTREYGLAVAGAHTIYRPSQQAQPGPALVIRTSGSPGPLARRVEEIVHGMDADRPVDNVNTLADLRADDIAPEKLNAALFSSFAVLALLIAAIGVLGVLAFTVSQRTREFGVRLALGARREQVLGMVLREGVTLALAALVCGVFSAWLLSRFLVDLLFGVAASDIGTYVAVGLTLSGVAVLAAYVPARRATQVDPMEALRSE